MKNIVTSLFLILSLNSISQTPTEIAKNSINSTVSIVSLDNNSQPLAYGSGFIIENELIVTNVHVVEGSNAVYILKNEEQKQYWVTGYVAIDKLNDLVILKATGIFGNKLKLGSNYKPEIGEKVYAVGNPKGLRGTFSEGIISGIRDMNNSNLLQITAPISPGSSGGPVLNSQGEVIGIAVASYSSGQNLNFAIPLKYLENLVLKVATSQSLSNIKPQSKSSTSNTINSNIKEGVTLRNIQYDSQKFIFFSIKNNLPYRISDIKILFLVYDKTGTIVDYTEDTFFKYSKYFEDTGIRPYLAKSIDYSGGAPEVNAVSGAYVKTRILDFKIIEEQ